MRYAYGTCGLWHADERPENAKKHTEQSALRDHEAARSLRTAMRPGRLRVGRQGVGQAALSQGVEQAGQAVEGREVEPAGVLQQRGVQGVGGKREVDELARAQLALP